MVVDGTGRPRVTADVAVDGGVVTAVGADVGEGAQTFDATGCVVTPGFVDPHTHLDVQLFWDPAATPSCLHGVTTVVLSSCGFGVAPCPPGGKEYTLRSLEFVEEIPFVTTSAAVPFGWQTWGEYADALDALPLGVNVTGYVPHSALRYAVMGERARHDVATDVDRAALVSALEDALAAGAVGFSTSRGPNHVDGFGDPVPSRWADEAELAALVDACGDRLWQINVTAKFDTNADALTKEVDGWARLGTLGRTRMTWSPLFSQRGSDTWTKALEHNAKLRDEGAVVVPQVSTQMVTTAFSFADAPPILFRITGWGGPLAGFDRLSRAERVARLSDGDVRRALRDAGGDGPGMLDPRFGRWTIAASPSRPELTDQTVASLGPDPVGTLLELVIADDLETVIQIGLINDDPEGVVGLVTDEGTLIALGDAGAHVNSVTGFAYPTRVLTDMVRDGGHLTLEDGVHRLTERPARLFGITDRGTLVPGQAADVCVIDLGGLALERSEIRRDLPEGSSRLFQGARGYRAVFVNGTQVIDRDRLVERAAGPGRVLRV